MKYSIKLVFRSVPWLLRDISDGWAQPIVWNIYLYTADIGKTLSFSFHVVDIVCVIEFQNASMTFITD